MGPSTLTDRYLAQARDSGTKMSIFLPSGIQLRGWLIEFDESSLFFTVESVAEAPVAPNSFPSTRDKEVLSDMTQLVNRNHVVTFRPVKPDNSKE